MYFGHGWSRGKVHVEEGRRHNGRSLTLEAAQVMDLMEYTLHTRSELLQLSRKQTDALFVSVGALRPGSGQAGNKLNNTLNKLLEQITLGPQDRGPKVKTLQQLRGNVITYWIRTLNLREPQHKAGSAARRKQYRGVSDQ